VRTRDCDGRSVVRVVRVVVRLGSREVPDEEFETRCVFTGLAGGELHRVDDEGFRRARTEEKPGSGLGGILEGLHVHAAAVVAVRSRCAPPRG